MMSSHVAWFVVLCIHSYALYTSILSGAQGGEVRAIETSFHTPIGIAVIGDLVDREDSTGL
jgi:hypothetical protein